MKEKMIVMRKAMAGLCLGLWCLCGAAVALTPRVDSCTPSSALQGAIIKVQVNGASFESGATVTINGGSIFDANTGTAALTSIEATFISANTLEVYLDVDPLANATLRSVTVNNPGGESATGTGVFTVNTNTGGPSFGITIFQTPDGPASYEGNALQVDAGSLGFTANVSSVTVGLSTGTLKQKVLTSPVIAGRSKIYSETGDGRMAVTVAADGLSAVLTFLGTFDASVVCNHTLTLYVEDKNGTPSRQDYAVTFLRRQETPLGRVSSIATDDNKDPSATNQKNIYFNSDCDDANAEIMIVSQSSTLYNAPLPVTAGPNHTTLAFTDVPSGVYNIVIKLSNGSYKKGLVVIYRR